MFAAGLVLALLALFMLPMTVREIATSFARREFVRDVFIVESYTARSEDPVLTGKLESTGETYRTTRDSIVGVDRLSELYEKNQLEGARADVWYLPKRGIWESIDQIVGLRVQSPSEFGTGFAPWVIAAQILFAASAWLLIRQVLREIRAAPSSPRASSARTPE